MKNPINLIMSSLLLLNIVLFTQCTPKADKVLLEVEAAPDHFDSKGKSPTAATIAKWAALKNKMPFEDVRDFEEQIDLTTATVVAKSRRRQIPFRRSHPRSCFFPRCWPDSPRRVGAGINCRTGPDFTRTLICQAEADESGVSSRRISHLQRLERGTRLRLPESDWN